MPDNSSASPHDWFIRADHDFQTAKLLVDTGGYGEVIAFHIQQAVEKYLKGYLLGLGWNLVKTHDLELLLSEAVTHHQEFDDYLDFARELTALYIDSRYPLAPIEEFSVEELSGILSQAQQLVDKIKDLHKSR